MAFTGRNVFQAGEVLTASDMNSVVDQTVMVFDDTTARDTAIPEPVEGMVVYIKTNNSVLKYDGNGWVSIALDTNLTADRVMITDNGGDLVVSDVTVTELNKLDGLTATTADLNKLDGLTPTQTELNFVDGVTSSIQNQLDNKQPLTPSVNIKNANYTLASSDRGEVITISGNSQITVPDNTFVAGDRVDVVNVGLGTITFSAGSGLTLNSFEDAVTIIGQFQAATVLFGATNEAYLIGAIA